MSLRRLLTVLAVWGTGQACVAGPADSIERFDIDALPELRLLERLALGGSETEGPDAFGKVNSVALLPEEDAIAIADGTSQEVLLFTLDGRFLRKAGGRGGGPGEFRALRDMRGLTNGQIAVWDIQESRITLFRRDLDFPEAHRADLGPVEAMLPDFVGFLPDGRFVLRDQRSAMGMRDLPEGMRQDTVRLYLYDKTGEFCDTVAVLLDEPKWFRNRDRSWGREDLIFGRELITAIVGDEVWIGASGEYVFARYDTEGRILGEIRLGPVSRPASPEDVEQERERRVAAVQMPINLRVFDRGPSGLMDATERMTQARREAIRELASYETLPAYDRIVSGPHGRVLLREYPRPRDTEARWILVSRGRPVAILKLPRATEVKAFSETMIAVLESDEYDAPLVRVLELQEAAVAS